MVLGEVETERRVIDGKVVVEVLRRMHGPALAAAAVEVEASQAGIERALRAVAESSGAKLAKLKRDVLRELEVAGGISLKKTRSVREHRVELKDANLA
jgi:hypothetical protein